MPKPSTRPGDGAGIRRLVEEYTPDGTLGRVGLAGVTAAVGGFLFWLSLVGLFTGTALSAVFVAPPAAIGFVLCAGLTILTLWPVYLSAIGRVESPTEYAAERRSRSPPSPTERLKDEYRSGVLSEEEFERELEALLDDSDRPRPEERRDRSPRDDRLLEDTESDG